MDTWYFKLPWRTDKEGYDLPERISAEDLAHRLGCKLNDKDQLLKNKVLVGEVFPAKDIVAITDSWVRTLAALARLKELSRTTDTERTSDQT